MLSRLARVVVLAAVALVVALVSVVPDASAKSPTDWVVARAVSPSGGKVVLRVEAVIVHNGPGPLVYGWGLAQSRTNGFVAADTSNTRRVAITSSSGAGDYDIELLKLDGRIYHYSLTYVVREEFLDPGDVVSVLVFAGNGEMTHHGYGLVEDTAADVSAWEVVGSGSGAVLVGAPGDPGHAVYAEGFAYTAGAGAQVIARDVDEHVVGALSRDCETCDMWWRAPDGSDGTLLSAGANAPGDIFASYSTGDAGFHGPPGTWEFGWRGLTTGSFHNQPLVAAYAPLGPELAPLFDYDGLEVRDVVDLVTGAVGQ